MAGRAPDPLPRSLALMGISLLAIAVPVLAQNPARARPAGSAAAEIPAQERAQAEAKVVSYIREHLQPGRPLLITELEKTFTQPAERLALGKLYSAFFRIPLFVAGYQQKLGHPPTLATIADQFDLHVPGEADLLLRVMDSDPRVPHFLSRDSRTGEITKVDVAAIRSDPRFGQALDHQIAGWEGRRPPALTLQGLDGQPITLSNPSGKGLLLEVWFTGCPPCMQETPVLVNLSREFAGKGLLIVGANADQLLGLSYTDAVRQRYVREHHVDFPIAEWDKAANAAYGGISIFPTLFLMNSSGVVQQHWVGFVSAQELRAAAGKLVSGDAGSAAGGR
ncbi:MAG TPA: TlpA disulfide reductase family protein [Terriglobia bacterium]|nr:TlpA disulfide reductase family protein [Terriglobia bacterium]